MRNGVPSPTSYGEDSDNIVKTWDKKKIQGCICDEGIYRHNLYGFQGHACQEKTCTRGDDPVTGNFRVNEIQTITCKATAGHFRVGFRGQISEPISFDSPADNSLVALNGTVGVTRMSTRITTTSDLTNSLQYGDTVEIMYNNGASGDYTVVKNFTVAGTSVADQIIMAAYFDVTEPVGWETKTGLTAKIVKPSVKFLVEGMETVDTVQVSFVTANALHACQELGTAIKITFLGDFGGLPLLTSDASALVLNGIRGQQHDIDVVRTQVGTKEDAECNNRGLCDREEGRCKCFAGYSSGNNHQQKGVRGDCSFPDAYSSGET
jgi:hypothetical protein